MSDKPWIKLILPKRRYRSSGPGARWVHVDARNVHFSRDTESAARSVMGSDRQLKLFIGEQEYELPYKGIGKESPYKKSPYLVDVLQGVIRHIEHCIDLHKAFFDER